VGADDGTYINNSEKNIEDLGFSKLSNRQENSSGRTEISV